MLRSWGLVILLICLFVVFPVSVSGKDAYKPVELKLGQVYEGFKFVQEQYFAEFDITARLFRHEVTGAEVLKLETNDNNKVFSAIFKTLPEDDSGIGHILEHSVLCGSKNFPTKKPTEILGKGSITTFINALTYADKTQYPVASTNTKDFYNLMTVYVDAVFFPDIYDDHMTLKQEGWSYDLASKDAELKYNGIVYNEIKGSMSNRWRFMYTHMKKALFPDIFLKNEHGGLPEGIVTLTQEKYEAYHKKFYHPSNSYLYLYGDGNTLEELKLLQNNALKHFTKAERYTTPIQKKIGKMKEYTIEFPIASKDEEKGNATFAFIFNAGDMKDRETEAAFYLIDQALFYEASPYRKAILDSKLCKNIYSGYFNDLKQPFFYITVDYADFADKDKIIALVTEQLKLAARDGLDLGYLKSVINNQEYYLRRGEFGSDPKGYTLMNYVDYYWLHAGDPMRGLDSVGYFDIARKTLDNKKLGKIIDKYLVKSEFSAILSMKPHKGLTQEIDKAVADKLAAYKASLSEKEIDKLVQDTKDLEAYKNAPDKPEDIAKIPMLTLDDLSKEPIVYLADKDSIGATPVVKYSVNTKGIAYFELLFDARTVPLELIPYLKLATLLQGRLDTEKYTFGDLEMEMQMTGGGAYVGLDHYVYKNNANDLRPYYQLSGNTLVPRLEKMLELGSEMMYRTKFNDDERMLQKIKMFKENIKSYFNNSGNVCANTRLRSYLDASGKFEEITDGIDFYNFVTDIEANWATKKDETIAKMKKALALVWNQENLTVGITCSESDYADVKKKIGKFIATLPAGKNPQVTYSFDLKPNFEGIKSASKVQYVVMGMNASDLGYRYDGRMLVMKNIVDNEYLYEQVRVLGGAYGVWAGFSPSGFISFTSYRDPNLKRTVDVYKGVPDFVANYTTTEENLMRIKIGVISGFDYPLTISQQGNTAMFNTLKGYDVEYFRTTRKEVFDTTLDDVRSFAPIFKKILDRSSLCIFGNEESIGKEKTLFTNIIELK